MKKRPFTRVIRELNREYSFSNRYEYKLEYIRPYRVSGKVTDYQVGLGLYDHALMKCSQIEVSVYSYRLGAEAPNEERALNSRAFYMAAFNQVFKAVAQFVTQTAAIRAIDPYEVFEIVKPPKRLVKNGTLYNI